MFDMKEAIEEYNNLMIAGFAELPDTEIAEEYFADACYVLNQIEEHNGRTAKELELKYAINPRDFAY